MNIADSNYNINTTYSGNVTISVSKGQETVNTNGMSANAQITQVAEGQVFHGQIQNITGDQVDILLSNNKTLIAHMTEALTMNIGDSLNFLVKENNGTNVVIKPYNQETNAMKDNAIFKALELNNLSPSEKNYQIAEALMNKNMPLDKASMQKIMQQAYKYPDASIDTLVSMNKLNIPVTETTITQFNEYMSNNHQMMNNLNSLINDIATMSNEIISNIPVGGEANNQAALTEILSFNNNLLSSLSDLPDMPVADFKAIINESISQNANITAQETNVTTQDSIDVNVLKQSASILESNVLNGESIQETDGQPVQGQNFVSEIATNLANKFSVNENNIQDIFTKLSEMGFSDKTLNAVAKESETPMQLLNNINKLISDAKELGVDLPVEQIKDLLKSDSYVDMFTEITKKKLSIDPNSMKDPHELDELYKNIYDKAGKLAESFSGSSNAGKNLSDSAKSMQDKIEFIQNLNEMYAYAQIPVNISGTNMNSELFVYMNKKNLRETKEEVSALLHLDMEHLGPTDVHVSLRGSTVHTRFYVEDEESARIIDEHMNVLEKSINDNGFSLTNEVITREPTLNTGGNMVVKEMFGDDLEQSVKRYTFDIRM